MGCWHLGKHLNQQPNSFRDRGRQAKGDLSLPGSDYKYLQYLEKVKANIQEFQLGLSHGWQGPKYLSHYLLSPFCTSVESWNREGNGVWFLKQQLTNCYAKCASSSNFLKCLQNCYYFLALLNGIFYKNSLTLTRNSRKILGVPYNSEVRESGQAGSVTGAGSRTWSLYVDIRAFSSLGGGAWKFTSCCWSYLQRALWSLSCQIFANCNLSQ